MTPWMLHFDMRAPSFGAPRRDLYRAALDMSEWADGRGAESVVLSEHHGEEDGYLPSPLTMAAAIAARTERLLISILALVPTLRDPIATAEDALVVDQISGGRIVLGLVPGYVPEEFEMFGVDHSRRGSIFEEKATALVAALTGEPFKWEGRVARVTPGPASGRRPMVVLGGASRAAARRAARIGDGFFPTVADEAVLAEYRAECERLGRAPGVVGAPHGPMAVFISHDVERARAVLEPHCLHEANAYGRWAHHHERGPYSALDANALWSSGLYEVVDPDGAVALARSLPAGSRMAFKPLIGGLDPEVGWETLRLWVDEALPVLESRGSR